MRDIRQAPFVWQSVTAMALIRDRFSGKELTTAIAIYQSMTEVSNEERGSKFSAFRQKLAARAGCGVRTLDRYADEFIALGLLQKVTVKQGVVNGPNEWELLEPGVAQPNAPGGGAAKCTTPGAANDTPIQQPTLEGMPTSTPSREETGRQGNPDDAQFVLDYWLSIMDAAEKKVRVREMTPSRKRVIDKALKERDRDLCCRALDGLLAWWKARGGNLELSRVFQGRPGGSPLGEQIDWFISQAEKTGVAGSGILSADPAVIARRKQEVQRGHRLKGDPLAVRKAEEAEAWLKQHGVEIVRRDDGFPTFR